VAQGRNEHFRSGSIQQEDLDRALKLAQIQKLNASAAKDRESVRESMNQQLTPTKTL
jgi:hypothetical protein